MRRRLRAARAVTSSGDFSRAALREAWIPSARKSSRGRATRTRAKAHSRAARLAGENDSAISSACCPRARNAAGWGRPPAAKARTVMERLRGAKDSWMRTACSPSASKTSGGGSGTVLNARTAAARSLALKSTARRTDCRDRARTSSGCPARWPLCEKAHSTAASSGGEKSGAFTHACWQRASSTAGSGCCIDTMARATCARP
mmetsp:Transcript_25576/g.71526  ORF Transcript_25576/g.71526 Transcript_25576/m.71526 type:complete len:203 (+) Transcript_25576:763-1371(+)